MILSEELEELFFKATLLPMEDRLAFASKQCSNNAQMHTDLLRLLESHAEPDGLLDRPLTLDADLLAHLGLHETCSYNASVLTELTGFLEPANRPENLGRISHFDVHDVLGRGASATVLRATDSKLHRVVVLKVLSAKLAIDRLARKRFIREARIAAGITDKNLVTIYEVEDQHPRPFIVMEYFNAVSLHDYLKSHPQLSVAETVEIAIGICRGLSKVHARKIVHRDLKLANILIQPDTKEVKITDFGIAKNMDGREDQELTLLNQILGTPMFMSPEQVQGRLLDARSDLFSLGSILYRMLTQAFPFDGSNAQSVMEKLVNCSPRPAHELVPEIPGWLGNLVSKLHHRNPEDRYQTAEQIIQALEFGRTQGKSVPETDPAVQIRTGNVPESSKKHSQRMQPWSVKRVCMYAAPAIIALFMGIVLKLKNADGELIVMCDDPKAEITVKAAQGPATQHMEVAIGDGNRMLLKAGSWEIAILGEAADEYVITPNQVQIVRGGVAKVNVLRKSDALLGDHAKSTPALNRKNPVDPAIETLLTGGAMLVIRSDEQAEEIYVRKIEELPDTEFQVHSIYPGDLSTWKQPLDFQLLAAFPRVATLSFSGAKFSDSDVHRLLAFRQLEFLDLRDTDVTDAGMTTLINTSSLLALSLEGTAVGVQGLRELSGMRSLGSLQLSGSKIDDEAMRAVAEFPNLYALSCINCRLTDDGIQHLANRKEWQQLTFYGTDITDAGIKMLSESKNLRALILQNNNQITDACVDDLLRLPSLEEIDVRRTGISPEGRKRLSMIGTFHGSPDEP